MAVGVGGKDSQAGVDRGQDTGGSGGDKKGAPGKADKSETDKATVGEKSKIGKPTDLLSGATKEEVGGLLGAASDLVGKLAGTAVPGLDLGLQKNVVTEQVSPKISLDPVDFAIGVLSAVVPPAGLIAGVAKGLSGKGEEAPAPDRKQKEKATPAAKETAKTPAKLSIVKPILTGNIETSIDNSLFDQILSNISKGKSPFLSKL